MKKLLTLILSIILFASVASAEFFSDVIVTSPNGIWTDSRAYSTLNAAVAAVGANDREIVIASPQTVTTLTVPSNVRLKFLRNGSITNSGYLNIQTKNIEADNRRIFTGAGNIDFANGTVVKTGWFSNIESAFALTVNDTVTLIVSKPQTITANYSPGNNVNLKWESPGNILTVNLGVVVGNLKLIEAGNFQLFAGSGDFDFLDGTRLKLAWFNHLRSVLNWVESEEVTIVVSGTNQVSFDDVATINESFDFSSEQGQFAIDPGRILTINSPANIIAQPNQQIKSGAGVLTFASGGIICSGWYPDFATAVTDIGTLKTTLEVTKPETIDSVTLNVNTLLAFRSPGNELSMNESQTLTIAGKIDAGKFRIFKGRIAYIGQVIPQWWGALGDGLGLTPTDIGEDISTASWNSWDNTPFKTNLTYSPYSTGGVAPFAPPTAKPFQNTDTWDYIGGNSALWSGSNSTYFPTGTYVINISGSGRAYPGLIIMRGQEQTIMGDGSFQTSVVTKEDNAFFAANNFGVENTYKLLTLYRPGGPQTVIRDLQLAGPNSYGQNNKNLTMIWAKNINGVTFRDLWLTTGDMGISMEDSSGDVYAKGITSEYFFSETIRTDATSDINIDFCNLWDSAGIIYQQGVVALGVTRVSNTRFIGFGSGSVIADSAILTGNTFFAAAGSTSVQVVHNSVITGNTFNDTLAGPALEVGHDSSITGNHFIIGANHPAIDVGNSAAASANNISITGNTFIKTDAAAEGQNYAITAYEAGVGYTQAATPSTLIVGNTFTGRAMNGIGLATMAKNTFDNVLGPDSYATATTAQLADITSAINTIGKTLSKAVWNSNTAKFVYATGAAAGDVWNDAVGALAHTPV